MVQEAALAIYQQIFITNNHSAPKAYVEITARSRMIDALRVVNRGSRGRADARRSAKELPETGHGGLLVELSLEGLTTNEDGEQMDILAAEEKEKSLQEMERTTLLRVVMKLVTDTTWPPSKQRFMQGVAIKRLLDNYTCKSIGEMYGVTESRISQIMKNIILPTIRQNLVSLEIETPEDFIEVLLRTV